jgi:lipopolysaccharide transport system permease protein
MTRKQDVDMQDQSQETQWWTTIITPREKWYHLRLKELWDYRQLVWLFVRRDFVSAYKQTILGYFWFVFPPILSAIASTFFYSNVISLPTDGLPPFLFYMSGTFMFNIFSACFINTSNIFGENASIFGKVYFPRLTVPLAKVLIYLINVAVQFFLFIGFLIYFITQGADIQPNLWALSLPLLLLMAVFIGLGPGLITSAMTARYRDLGRLVTFFTTLVTYITPVVYPLSNVPEHLKIYFKLNPVTAIIETFRYGFLGQGVLDLGMLAYSFAVSVVFLLIGVFWFRSMESTFLDTV